MSTATVTPLIDLADAPGDYGLRFPVALTPEAFARAVQQWDGRTPAGTSAARRSDQLLAGLAYALRQRGQGRREITFPATVWSGQGRTRLGELTARAEWGEDGAPRVVVDVDSDGCTH